MHGGWRFWHAAACCAGLRAAREEHRLHKVLTDGGIRLGVVLSDIHGKSGRTMIKALVAGEPAQALLRYADPRLKASADLIQAMLPRTR
jgi:hypothetical protein